MGIFIIFIQQIIVRRRKSNNMNFVLQIRNLHLIENNFEKIKVGGISIFEKKEIS